MDRFVYIHGFNSDGNSRSGRELAQLLGVPVICPEYDYARPFSECLTRIREQIIEAIDERGDRLTVMGSSLGGFFALQLRHPAIIHTVAWNPVVFPAIQLEQFLGQNRRFADGAEWEFTREVLLTYAQAPDPRPWRNAMWSYEHRLAKEAKPDCEPYFVLGTRRYTLSADDEQAVLPGSPAEREATRVPQRDIFLADADELLDARLTRAFWQGIATLHDIVSGHQILDYGHATELLKHGKILDSFAAWEAGADWAAPFCEARAFSMAGLFMPGKKLDETYHFLWLADVPYLELEGRKDGALCPLVAVFFQPRHKGRIQRLLAGLVKLCGRNAYILLQADGNGLRQQCAANRLQDAQYPITLPEARAFATVVQAVIPGWQGARAHWHGHALHGSLNRAMMRNHFATLWEQYEDPVAAFKAGGRPAESGE